ncbi:Pyriculol/pyriculariol biosynthesis cluster transcription factor [Paramyrothecium foliicola]|nr:Pyriculol/pyriculariol biosynthesis cluster transcription factor [Paramyrothecium foliicola]
MKPTFAPEVEEAASMTSTDASQPLLGAGSNTAAPALSTVPWTPKPQSCEQCHDRKIRCDRRSPCSNCQRANVTCLLAARLKRSRRNPDKGAATSHLQDRLRNLENLITVLISQREQSNAVTSPQISDSSRASLPGASPKGNEPGSKVSTPPSTTSTSTKPSGRLISKGASQDIYIGNGFWPTITDELERIKQHAHLLEDDDSNPEDEAADSGAPVRDSKSVSFNRYIFLFQGFRHGAAPDLAEFRPLPSQVPFFLDRFAENVNMFYQLVHIPTITKIVQTSRHGGSLTLTASHEALMFSIYYATIVSLNDADVLVNFGSSKTDLLVQFRLGLELALAQADFLGNPDIVLFQAFCVFLLVSRSEDSPRYAWMMTGLAIRVAHSLGIQRDGSHFERLTPFEVEERRRAWWALCSLDLRVSEDLGTDVSIDPGSFDTKYPLNVNIHDINPETKETPPERQGYADLTITLIWVSMCDTIRQAMGASCADGVAELQSLRGMLDDKFKKIEQSYVKHAAEASTVAGWADEAYILLPTLLSNSEELYTKNMGYDLIVAAIEVAEYNHSLYTEEVCRHWLFDTYTHWHAIICLLVEITRRPWSPIVERAWIAAHSQWLFPKQKKSEKTQELLFSLRKLITKARRHRELEIRRLRSDPSALQELEKADADVAFPATSIFDPSGNKEAFIQHWRLIFSTAGTTVSQNQSFSNPGPDSSELRSLHGSIPVLAFGTNATPIVEQQTAWSNMNPDSSTGGAGIPKDGQSWSQPWPCHNPINAENFAGQNRTVYDAAVLDDSTASKFNTWTDAQPTDPSLAQWLWADESSTNDLAADLGATMDLDDKFDWKVWVESVKNLDDEKI